VRYGSWKNGKRERWIDEEEYNYEAEKIEKEIRYS
jgi:hypothetical protein